MTDLQFDKLLAQRMDEKGIPWAPMGEEHQPEVRHRRRKEIDKFLDEKEERDWLRACGMSGDYDEWA